MRRGALVALLLVVLAAWPAGALETATFGIGPGPGAATVPGAERLVLRPPRGGEDRTTVRLWNRTADPIRLILTAEPVSLRADGAAELGGDAEGARWLRLPRRPLLVPARGSTTVEVTARVPRRAAARERTAAIVAEPVLDGAVAPAVVERLALVVFVRPAGDGGFGWWATAAGGAAALVAVAVVVVASRRRGRTGSRTE